jgi:hypothetical protein
MLWANGPFGGLTHQICSGGEQGDVGQEWGPGVVVKGGVIAVVAGVMASGWSGTPRGGGEAGRSDAFTG